MPNPDNLLKGSLDLTYLYLLFLALEFCPGNQTKAAVLRIHPKVPSFLQVINQISQIPQKLTNLASSFDLGFVNVNLICYLVRDLKQEDKHMIIGGITRAQSECSRFADDLQLLTMTGT